MGHDSASRHWTTPPSSQPASLLLYASNLLHVYESGHRAQIRRCSLLSLPSASLRAPEASHVAGLGASRSATDFLGVDLMWLQCGGADVVSHTISGPIWPMPLCG